MKAAAVQPAIHALIEGKNFAGLKRALAEMEIHDLAELTAALEGPDLAMCFRLLTPDRASHVLSELEPTEQEALLTTFSSEQAAAIIRDMAPDDRTELLEELPGELAQRVMNYLAGEDLHVARTLLGYPEESVGRLMTPKYVAVRPDWQVTEILDHLRKVGRHKETLNIILVTDRQWKLLGEIRLEEMILSEPHRTARELMEEHVDFLRAYDDKEEAIELFKKYDAVALPVLNSEDVLVGIVTVDDVLDVAEEENTEDFQRVTGMEPLEYSYFGTRFSRMLSKRLPWLILLLVAQTLTTVALLGFNGVYLFPVLVAFMPLINSPAGNTGSQMAGLMIRGLAVQEITLTDWARVLGREMFHGLALGAMLGVLGAAAAMVFANFLDTRQILPSQLALAVGISIALAVTIGNLIGCLLPFVFKRLGLDPAVTSGPFLASLMDVSGILIYFSIATATFAALS
jgi:magnesium transporter